MGLSFLKDAVEVAGAAGVGAEEFSRVAAGLVDAPIAFLLFFGRVVAFDGDRKVLISSWSFFALCGC